MGGVRPPAKHLTIEAVGHENVRIRLAVQDNVVRPAAHCAQLPGDKLVEQAIALAVRWLMQ